jgi:hypothetical protein
VTVNLTNTAPALTRNTGRLLQAWLMQVFLKLFAKIYAQLMAGVLHPYRGDKAIAKNSRWVPIAV